MDSIGPTGSDAGPTGATGTTGTYIITIDELTSTQEAISQQQITNLSALQAVYQPDPNVLKNQLISWAAQGFPSNWVVFSLQLNPPSVCLDGQSRQFYEYAQYLLGSTLAECISTLNNQVLGVTFNFFLADINTLGLNVTKD